MLKTKEGQQERRKRMMTSRTTGKLLQCPSQELLLIRLLQGQTDLQHRLRRYAKSSKLIEGVRK